MSKDRNPRSNEAIAERLRLLREAMGMTQSELALRVGVHQSTYNAYETGSRRPSLNDGIKMKMALGISVDWLYFDDEVGISEGIISQIRDYVGNHAESETVRISEETRLQILAARLDKGWSQATLAQRADTSQQTIDRIEAGKTKMSAAAPAICRTLGIACALSGITSPPTESADEPLAQNVKLEHTGATGQDASALHAEIEGLREIIRRLDDQVRRFDDQVRDLREERDAWRAQATGRAPSAVEDVADR